MPTEMKRAVGLFQDRRSAETAMKQLKDSGFDMNKVSIVHKGEETGNIHGANVNQESDNKVASAAGKGATAGGIGGGAIGLIGSLGILAIPGVGPAAELGVLLANTVFAGAVGAAGGGLIGALVGWGLPEDRAKYYDERINKSGDYLVLVEGDAATLKTAENILHNNRVSDWYTFSAENHPPTISSATTATDTSAYTDGRPLSASDRGSIV